MKNLKDVLLESLNESSPKYSREIDKRISKLKKEPSSDEMNELCEWIASLKDEESCGYFLRAITTKFPKIKEEWGEIEGHDKYQKGLEILTDAYPEYGE